MKVNLRDMGMTQDVWIQGDRGCVFTGAVCSSGMCVHRGGKFTGSCVHKRYFCNL